MGEIELVRRKKNTNKENNTINKEKNKKEKKNKFKFDLKNMFKIKNNDKIKNKFVIKDILIILLCLFMIIIAITKIVLLKSCFGCYLLIILGVINLPMISDKIFRKPWLLLANFFVIIITLTTTVLYTNYYGRWYNDEVNIKINKKSFFIGGEKHSYKEVLFPSVKRLIVNIEEKEVMFHYWLDRGNNEIFLCKFENNQCIEFYKPKVKNIFYKYIGD